MIRHSLRHLIKLADKLKLFYLGYSLVLKKTDHKVEKNKLAIVYNVHNSLPETNNGYAMRTHYVATSILHEDINVSVVTRVGFPLDLNAIGRYADNSKLHKIDNIEYNRLEKVGFGWGEVSISKYISNYAIMLSVFTANKNANIIHSASNYLNGLSGANAANILNIPSIYEVRGFWEITKASREPNFKNSLEYKLQKQLEIQACEEVTSIIALSEVVKEELVRRGIHKDKIYTVPNGVDTSILKPLNKDINIVEKYNLNDKFVVGFIGSVVDYEGLGLLVKAAKKIENEYKNRFRYLIVGDGNDLNNIKDELKKNSIEDLFIFTGRVPYEEVEKYYSVIDIACYPRLDWEVCQIVSPKKPFEAMAYGIPIISSSVRANSYFIEDGVTGLIHQKENVESIIENILKLYKDLNLRTKLSKNGRHWVVKNRDSRMTGNRLKQIYQETISRYHDEIS